MSDDFLDPNPLLDDALIMRLVYDIAADIHEGPTLALRYGFADEKAMRRYLVRHPQIVRKAQKARALMESDESSEIRARLKATQATEELIPVTASIVWDPRIAPQQRIDAFKQLSRVSGLDGSAAAMAAKNAGGPAFTLNILFRDKPPERLEFVNAMPVADMPARAAPGITDESDEAEWDEEI